MYLAAFDEVVDLFHAAAGNATLAALPWYGSDGVALTTRLLRDRRAASFARRVAYPNPTVGLPDPVLRRARLLIRRTRARLGRAPDALALTAYDALRIAVVAQQQAAPGERGLRRALRATANGYAGVTGKMILNSAGDRAYGSFRLLVDLPERIEVPLEAHGRVRCPRRGCGSHLRQRSLLVGSADTRRRRRRRGARFVTIF